MDNSYCSVEERSPWDCNSYYWTIVIALLLSAIRSKCGSYIAVRSQFLLFIYWTIVTAVSARYCCTYAEQVRQLYTFMQQSLMEC
ncbi:MAG: hypothetical protein SWX82_31795 [Cyanobacteriota bacterium]|nr:hypothetical protein [Cyanobacteriota bacterium]